MKKTRSNHANQVTTVHLISVVNGHHLSPEVQKHHLPVQFVLKQIVRKHQTKPNQLRVYKVTHLNSSKTSQSKGKMGNKKLFRTKETKE